MRVSETVVRWASAQTKRRRSWLNLHVLLGLYAFHQEKEAQALRLWNRGDHDACGDVHLLPRRICRDPCRRACPRFAERSQAPSAPWDLSVDMGGRGAYRRPSARYDDFELQRTPRGLAQERVDLWTNAEEAFLHSPIVGNGFATFQLEEHVGDLRDTHNWYVKVLVETGILGLIPVLFMLQQMLSTSYRLLKRGDDPLYRGLGLGLFVAICACLVANCFGDRWTYLEITGLLWILVAAAIRATQFTLASPELAPVEGGLMRTRQYLGSCIRSCPKTQSLATASNPIQPCFAIEAKTSSRR